MKKFTFLFVIPLITLLFVASAYFLAPTIFGEKVHAQTTTTPIVKIIDLYTSVQSDGRLDCQRKQQGCSVEDDSFLFSSFTEIHSGVFRQEYVEIPPYPGHRATTTQGDPNNPLQGADFNQNADSTNLRMYSGTNFSSSYAKSYGVTNEKVEIKHTDTTDLYNVKYTHVKPPAVDRYKYPDIHLTGKAARDRGTPINPMADKGYSNARGEDSKTIQVMYNDYSDSGVDKDLGVMFGSQKGVFVNGNGTSKYKIIIGVNAYSWSLEKSGNNDDISPMKGNAYSCGDITIHGYKTTLVNGICQTQILVSDGYFDITPIVGDGKHTRYVYDEPTIIGDPVEVTLGSRLTPQNPPHKSLPNKSFSLQGKDFDVTGNVITLRNEQGGSFTYNVPSTNNGTILTFTPNVAPGHYYVQISNSQGLSNEIDLIIAVPSVTVLTRMDGEVVDSLDQDNTCLSTLQTPSISIAGNCARTRTTLGTFPVTIGTTTTMQTIPLANGPYSLVWNSGFPADADHTVSPTVTPGQTMSAENPYLTFYVDFKSATPQDPAPIKPVMTVASTYQDITYAWVNNDPTITSYTLMQTVPATTTLITGNATLNRYILSAQPGQGLRYCAVLVASNAKGNTTSSAEVCGRTLKYQSGGGGGGGSYMEPIPSQEMEKIPDNQVSFFGTSSAFFGNVWDALVRLLSGVR